MDLTDPTDCVTQYNFICSKWGSNPPPNSISTVKTSSFSFLKYISFSTSFLDWEKAVRKSLKSSEGHQNMSLFRKWQKNLNYSRTSMARTLMARLPRLFRSHSLVPWNKSDSCRSGMIYDDFLFYIEKWYIVCTHWNRLVEAILMRTHNTPSC